MKIEMNTNIARAIAHDAADRQMRSHGRKKWNRADYNLAANVMNKLLPHGYHDDSPKAKQK